MVAFKNLFLFVLGVSALSIPTEVKRQASAVKSGLSTINSDTQKLIQATNDYNGGLNKAIAIQNAGNQVNDDIRSTTNTANRSPTATESEARDILAYVNNTLKPSTKASIDALISKHDYFVKDGIRQNVQNSLKTSLSNNNALSDALIAKTPTSQQDQARAAKAAIAAEIQRGINAFAS